MPSGRHLLFLGVFAGAGLLSVSISQEQVALGYELGKQERRLRKAREALVTERAHFQALRVPTRVMRMAWELDLPLAPASPLTLFPRREAGEAQPGMAVPAVP